MGGPVRDRRSDRFPGKRQGFIRNGRRPARRLRLGGAMNDSMNDFPALGFDPQNAAERLREQGAAGMLLTSPENVYYTTGYTCLPSSGNPILYTLRNRLPFFSHVDAEGQVTLLLGVLGGGGQLRRRPLGRLRRVRRGRSGRDESRHRKARRRQAARRRIHVAGLRRRGARPAPEPRRSSSTA